MSLFSLLERTARQWPDGGAVYLGERCVHTWATLHKRALCLAGALLRSCKPGSRIAIATENSPEYLELMFGSWAAGAVIVPMNYKLHPREMRQVLVDAGAALIFSSPSLAPGLRAALPADMQGLVIELGSPAYSAMVQGPPVRPQPVDAQTLAWLFYTSGTTGQSKGAMLSHRNLMAMTISHLADVEVIDEGCSQIHAAPMSHGSGLYIPAYVAKGARQVVADSRGFEPTEFLELCQVHPGCGSFLAPTMVQRLRLAAESSKCRPAGLRTIVYGGGPMYVEELRKSIVVFGSVFVQIYGQGEAPMTITWLRREDHASVDDSILGSVGMPRTGVEVRVVDEHGEPVPAGTAGEVVCKGDVVMQGYWNNPQGTAEAMKGGWLFTGDVGSVDERGYLTLRDRSKDVVISGGSNIYPREVEEALLSCRGVLEVCVVGEPDSEWGENVIAFVVCETGASVSVAELDRCCLDRIARFKRPKHYHFIDALPKNSYGKVLKRELRSGLDDLKGRTV